MSKRQPNSPKKDVIIDSPKASQPPADTDLGEISPARLTSSQKEKFLSLGSQEAMQIVEQVHQMSQDTKMKSTITSPRAGY